MYNELVDVILESGVSQHLMEMTPHEVSNRLDQNNALQVKVFIIFDGYLGVDLFHRIAVHNYQSGLEIQESPGQTFEEVVDQALLNERYPVWGQLFLFRITWGKGNLSCQMPYFYAILARTSHFSRI